MNTSQKFQRAAKHSVALFVLLICTPLFAATRYISVVGIDSGTCLNAAAPCQTFNYAINLAASGDTISAGTGTYTETLQIYKSLTLKGATMNRTIIDGGAAGAVLFVSSNIVISISDLTIQGGKNSNFAGGGIFNSGNLTLTSVKVSNNQTVGYDGGGIFNEGNLTLESCFVSNNYSGNSGGGIVNYIGTLTARNTVISNNTAQYGGGLLNYNGATATLTNVRLSRNTAFVTGGGMDNNNATATLNNVTFIANLASSSGGGMKNDNGATATFTNVTFSANSASNGNGGGLFNYGGTATLNNATFSSNFASTSGGGMYNDSATTTMADTTFSDNSTLGSGGGFENENANAALSNVTFSGNSASLGGGGFDQNSGITVKNTIVANSISSSDCSSGTPITSLGHNLSSGNTCGFGAQGDLNSVDPHLLPLANNGKKGYTQTLALAKGSPAIDKGDNSGCPVKDQRGLKRPNDGDANGTAVCDIGALEYKP